MSVVIEVRRKADDPTGVDFLVDGEKAVNITSERIWTDPATGEVTVRAVVRFNEDMIAPASSEAAASESGAESFWKDKKKKGTKA